MYEDNLEQLEPCTRTAIDMERSLCLSHLLLIQGYHISHPPPICKFMKKVLSESTSKFGCGVLPVGPHGPHDAGRVVGGEGRVAHVGEANVT